MTFFDFYLMCDNVDHDWFFDIRKNGKPICKETFFDIPYICKSSEIEYFKIVTETKTCVISLKNEQTQRA